MSRLFVVAMLVPLIATAAAGGAASRNRSSSRGPITLSERELFVAPRSADDTTASLSLSWNGSADPAWPGRDRLAQLGFDVSVDPVSEQAADHYARLLPRRVFVAMEFDGPSLQEVLEAQASDGRTFAGISRLVVVDVDRDAAALASRHPNARTHLIAAATLRVFRVDRTPTSAPTLSASVSNIEPSLIQVSGEAAGQLPVSNPFARGEMPRFDVDLYVGASSEPWVSAVRRR